MFILYFISFIHLSTIHPPTYHSLQLRTGHYFTFNSHHAGTLPVSPYFSPLLQSASNHQPSPSTLFYSTSSSLLPEFLPSTLLTSSSLFIDVATSDLLASASSIYNPTTITLLPSLQNPTNTTTSVVSLFRGNSAAPITGGRFVTCCNMCSDLQKSSVVIFYCTAGDFMLSFVDLY